MLAFVVVDIFVAFIAVVEVGALPVIFPVKVDTIDEQDKVPVKGTYDRGVVILSQYNVCVDPTTAKTGYNVEPVSVVEISALIALVPPPPPPVPFVIAVILPWLFMYMTQQE